MVTADDDQSLEVVHDGDPNTTTIETVVCSEGSDSDGDDFTYAWSTGSDSDCIDLELEAGSYTYDVVVTDAYGATAAESVNVSVDPEPNEAPYISTTDQNVTVEHDSDPLTTTAPVEICAESGDADGDPVSYEWSSGSREGSNVPEYLEGLSKQEIAHYFEKQDEAHDGSTIRDWSSRDYLENLSTEKSSSFGTNVYVPSGRDADHTFEACTDNYASEASWQIYGYGIGFLTDVMFFSDNFECQSVTLNLAPGMYSFEFYDSYGDGSISSYSIDGIELGSWSYWGAGTYTYTDIELSDSEDAGECLSVDLEEGSYDYTVTITDSYGASNSSTSTIIVNAEPNATPVAGTDGDQNVTVAHDSDPNTGTIDVAICATGTDADAGDDLTYSWDGGCTNDDSSTDSYGDSCTSWYDSSESEGSYGCSGGYDDDDFNAASQCCACGGGEGSGGETTVCVDRTLESGSYDYTVTVSDNYGANTSSSVNIIVNAEPNSIPTIGSICNINIEGEENCVSDNLSLEYFYIYDSESFDFNLIINADDLDTGDDLSYYLYNENNDEIANSSDNNLNFNLFLDEFNLDNYFRGLNSITLKVMDNYSETSGEYYEGIIDLIVTPYSLPPECPLLTEFVSVSIGEQVEFDVGNHCVDPDQVNGFSDDYIASCSFIQRTDIEGCADIELDIENSCEMGFRLPNIIEIGDNSSLEQDFCFDMSISDSHGLTISEPVRFKYEACDGSESPVLTDGNNLMALSCYPYDTSIEQFFDDNQFVEHIITQGLGVFKSEDGTFSGNMTDLDYHKGYWISAIDCGENNCEYSLNINGLKVSNELVYNLEDGNNLIGLHGFGPTIEVLGGPDFANTHFDYIIGQGLGYFNMVDDENSWAENLTDENSWAGNLTNIESWNGYWLDVNADDEEILEFQFNFSDEASISKSITPEINNHFKIAQSMEQSFYLAKEILVDEISTKPGDVILSFNGAVLTGSALIEDGPTTIVVMGRDMTEQTIGFHELGEVPEFKLYLHETGEIVDLVASNSKGWLSMTMHQMERLIGESQKLIVNEFSFNTPYPNPFNPVTTFRYGLPNEGSVSISVYNLNGKKVTDLFNDTQSMGLYSMEWNANQMAAGVYFINLEVVETDGEIHQQTQKVILLK